MVVFMQDNACIESFECFCFLNKIFVAVLDGNRAFSADFFPEPWQAQTAFITRPWLAIQRCNMRIDEDGFSASFSLKLFGLLIWGAAKPMPWALYMVSHMSSSNFFSSG